MTPQEREIIERVAEGVWCQHSNDLFSWWQCVFCYVSSESEHDKDCPVRQAKGILNNE